MRKIILIVSVLLGCIGVYGQKGKVLQAESYLTSGKLDEAKELIDVAINHPSCVEFAKAYFVKGQIYQGIFEKPEFKKLDPDALDKAWDAFEKALQLDDKGKFIKKMAPVYQAFIQDYTAKAVELYSAGDFAGALANFTKVLEIEKSPVLTEEGPAKIDTAIIFNAAVAAQRAANFPEAEKYLKLTLQYNYDPARTYAMLVNVLKEQKKEEEAVEYLKKGYELYPGSSYMLVELINYYLGSGNPEKAEVYLDAAIKQEPNNPSYYRAKGTLYDKMEQPDKAAEMYTKALEIDPNDFIAQYSLGYIKMNKVNDMRAKVMDIQDNDAYNKALMELLNEYEKLVPLFQKALEMKPGDSNTLHALKSLYFNLRNKDPKYEEKYKEVEAELDK